MANENLEKLNTAEIKQHTQEQELTTFQYVLKENLKILPASEINAFKEGPDFNDEHARMLEYIVAARPLNDHSTVFRRILRNGDLFTLKNTPDGISQDFGNIKYAAKALINAAHAWAELNGGDDYIQQKKEYERDQEAELERRKQLFASKKVA